MRVLFAFSGTPKLGGTEAVMMNIYRNIDRDFFTIDFLFYGDEKEDDSEFTTEVKQNGSIVYYVPVLRKGILDNHIAIKKILMGTHYDIVHAHMDASNTDFLRIAKIMGVKVRIAHSHNTAHLQNVHSIKDKIHKIYLDMCKVFLPKYATHYIACSNDAGEWLFGKQICSQDNYLLFKNAINAQDYVFSEIIRSRIRTEYEWKSKKVICHVGRLTYQKNHTFMIEVFKKVHDRLPESVLVFIGEGEEHDKIRNKIEDLKLCDCIKLLGNKTNVNELLQGADLFFFPSHYEGLGVALVEAEATGLKCIASKNVPREANVVGNVLFLGLEEEKDVWVKAIIKALSDKENRISQVAKIQASGFDMITNIKSLELFYKNAIK